MVPVEFFSRCRSFGDQEGAEQEEEAEAKAAYPREERGYVVGGVVEEDLEEGEESERVELWPVEAAVGAFWRGLWHAGGAFSGF